MPNATAIAIDKRAPQLRPQDFMRAEHGRTQWIANIRNMTQGVSFERLLENDFWSHVAGRMFDPNRNRTGWGDLIELYPEDMSYYSIVFVRDCGTNWARVKKVLYVDLTDDEPAPPPADTGMKVEFKGREQRHCVIRIKDNQVMAGGFNTKAEADMALIKFAQKQ